MSEALIAFRNLIRTRELAEYHRAELVWAVMAPHYKSPPKPPRRPSWMEQDDDGDA